MHSTLSTTGGSGDWKQRIEALQMVRSLLIAGAGQFEELTSQVGTHLTQSSSYSPFFSTVEKQLGESEVQNARFVLFHSDWPEGNQ